MLFIKSQTFKQELKEKTPYELIKRFQYIEKNITILNIMSKFNLKLISNKITKNEIN